MAAMKITTRVRGFVGEISGVSIARSLSREDLEAVLAAWLQYPVLIFPQQDLDPDALQNFADQLGGAGHDPYITPVPECPHVVEVCRDAHETTPIFGASWHSDWSFLSAPPSASLLSADIVPPRGGDTIFADGYRAYAALPHELRQRIACLRGIHTAAPAYGPVGLFARDDRSRSMQIVVSAAASAQETHPVVRTHPRSGRRCLFVNPAYTVGLVGVDAVKARALLERLFTHMTMPKFCYRHRWRAGALVLWDNRCVLHRAEGGYAGHCRVMRRATVVGERPIGILSGSVGRHLSTIKAR